MVQISHILSFSALVSLGSSVHLSYFSDNRLAARENRLAARENMLVARDNISTAASDSDGEFGFRIYSNNVRYDAQADRRYPHEDPWSERKDPLVDAIKSHTNTFPTLIGMQEILFNQLVDIKYELNGNNNSSPWTHVGVGRDDGVQAGEYSPILYNTNDWDLENGTYKWLSSTPDTPSKYPGADAIRIVTIATFRNKNTGKSVNFFNTHLDQKSEESRTFSANLIVNWIDEVPNNYPTFLSGDLNSLNNGTAYETFAQHFEDTQVVAYSHVNDDLPTYSGFESSDHGSTIDFIWAPSGANQNGNPVQVLRHEVIDNVFNGTYHFSDHRPIDTIISLS